MALVWVNALRLNDPHNGAKKKGREIHALQIHTLILRPDHIVTKLDAQAD